MLKPCINVIVNCMTTSFVYTMVIVLNFYTKVTVPVIVYL